MNKFYNDMDYYNLVDDILYNEKFKYVDGCCHHGLSRMDHSIRVSYYAYKIAKKMKLDYRATARAGLLHDFFLDDDLSVHKKRFSLFFHPYKSLENSCQYFNLSEMEKDIIITHMFPTLPHKVPKYMESWIVSMVDKVVATYEFYCSYAKNYVYRLSNLYLFLLLLGR